MLGHQETLEPKISERLLTEVKQPLSVNSIMFVRLNDSSLRSSSRQPITSRKTVRRWLPDSHKRVSGITGAVHTAVKISCAKCG